MTFTRAARLMLALLLVGLAGAAGSAARSGADRPEQTWTEISWPFLLDEWGAGQAFRCEDKACGLEARLFVRAKRGFCNCFQGVADDAEVDRLTDFEFLGGPSRPLASSASSPRVERSEASPLRDFMRERRFSPRATASSSVFRGGEHREATWRDGNERAIALFSLGTIDFGTPVSNGIVDTEVGDRIDRLERDVASLRRRVDALEDLERTAK